MYEKLTVKAFKESLGTGKYETATAARRAVGKASTLSDQEKDQCRRAIDSHFNVEPGKKTPTKKAAKPTAAKPAPKAPKPKATKPKASAKANVKSNGKSNGKQLGLFDPPPLGTGSLDDFKNLTTQMKIAEKTIQNTGSALGTLIEAKKICPDADLASNIESASSVLSSAVEIFRGVTHKVTSYMAASARAELELPAATPEVGQKTFEETSP